MITHHAHHTSAVATSAAAERGYESLPHPSYLLDLASADFSLFPLLKEHLRDTQFSSDNNVTAFVENFLQGQESQGELFYKDWNAQAAGTME